MKRYFTSDLELYGWVTLLCAILIVISALVLQYVAGVDEAICQVVLFIGATVECIGFAVIHSEKHPVFCAIDYVLALLFAFQAVFDSLKL